MGTSLVDLSPAELPHHLDDALRVYVAAMGYPAGTEQQRAGMWLEHSGRPGWRGVAAVAEGPAGPADAVAQGSPPGAGRVVGVAYGYRGAQDQWWQQQVMTGLLRAGLAQAVVTGLMTSYFELTELHVHPATQGHGLGEALARRLLADRPEAHVLLSTPETVGAPNRAWRLYRRLGFVDIIRGLHFAGDPRPFAILGRELPL